MEMNRCPNIIMQPKAKYPKSGVATNASTTISHPPSPTKQPHASVIQPKAKRPKSAIAADAPATLSHGTSNLMPQTQAPLLGIKSQTYVHPPAPTKQPQAPVMQPKAKRLKSGIAADAPATVSRGTSKLMPQTQAHPLGIKSQTYVHPSAPTKQPHIPVMQPKPKRPKSGIAADAPTTLSRGTSKLMPQTQAHPLDITSQTFVHSPAPTKQPQAPVMHPNANHSKSGASASASINLMPQASFQDYPTPLDPPLQVDPSLMHTSQSPVPSMGSTSRTSVPLSAPSEQSHAPDQERSYVGRESSRFWVVQVIDEHGSLKKIRLTKSGAFKQPQGQRIVVPFDRQLRAYGDEAAVLSAACGRIVSEPANVPINYKSWRLVINGYKENCWNILKNLFHFQAPELVAKRYCLLNMGTKYRNHKLDLWADNFDPSYSRDQLIANVPKGIPIDQWSSFVDYHLSEEYKELCRKNAEVKKKQTIPHTGGSKLLSTKQHEMEVHAQREVDRSEVYIETHKTKDGSYVNDEAKLAGEQIEKELSQNPNSRTISKDDVLSKVLGPDHSGRVHSLGLGGLHSVAFGSTTRFSGIGCNFSSSDSTEASQLKEEVTSLKTQLATTNENFNSFKNVMLAYIQMKEGHIPAEFGSLLSTTSPMDDEGTEEDEWGEDDPTP